MAKKRNLTDLIVLRHSWWQHLLFWALVLFILLNIFPSSSKLQKIDLIYTLLFTLPIAGACYLNLYLLIPRFLVRERYLLYTLLFPALVALGALFLYMLFDRWIDFILPGFFFISYFSVWELMLFVGSVMGLTTLLKLSRSWFKLLRLERIQSRQQLRSLQDQINPHFLLNSLQTIYALSLKNDERTPAVILKLSDILKYTLYESEQSRILLSEEIGLIRDYMDMFRYRVDRDRADLQLQTEGEAAGLRIAPMLLLPFIENSFKHGLKEEGGQVHIHVSIAIGKNSLEFCVENSSAVKSQDAHEQKGIGIENTRLRLDLLYPGKHRLSIKEESATFSVQLKLELED